MKALKTLLVGIIFVAANAAAAIPDGYYSTADGLAANELKNALMNIISVHNILAYSDLWEYYPYTYYCIDNPDQVLDLYSNDVTYFANYSALNKEHVVPRSWWGGSTADGPGCDLYNVMPSEEKANGAKGNYPLGTVAAATFDNGAIKVGSSAVSGFSGIVFEPADSSKGDFARVYFYVAACYPNIAWDDNDAEAMTNASGLTLQSWVIPTLLEWNAADPVDAAEIQRNEDISKYQQNRNPFIDYPALADYIWGDCADESFYFDRHSANEGEPNSSLKTKAPVFSLDYGTADDPTSVADGTELIVKAGAARAALHVRVNNGDWQEATAADTNAQIAVTITGETVVEAYCTNDGYADSDIITAYFNGIDLDSEYLLYEAFDAVTTGDNTNTGGSSTRWEGNENFPVVSNAFCAGNALRLGASGSVGSITSRTLDTAGGTLSVEFDVKGWSTVEGDILVSLAADSQSANAAAQTVSYSATITEPFEHVALTFNNISANPTLTIATSSKRAFIDNIICTGLTDDIAIPAANTSDTASPAYNLAGQRISPAAHGIIIQNGKKILK